MFSGLKIRMRKIYQYYTSYELPEQLSRAIKENKLEIVKLIITRHPELLNSLDNQLGTPLHWAAEHKRQQIAEWLYEQKADINLPNYAGKTPLHFAARRSFPMVKYFIANHAVVNKVSDDGNTPLHEAVMHGVPVTVEHLLQNNADPNVRNSSEQGNHMPLHYAAEMGELASVKLLVEAKAEIDARGESILVNDVGFTPVHYCVHQKNEKAEKALKQKGFQINKPCKSEKRQGGMYTPLHLASLRGHREVRDYLVEQRAQTEITDKCGYTPEDLADEMGYFQEEITPAPLVKENNLSVKNEKKEETTQAPSNSAWSAIRRGVKRKKEEDPKETENYSYKH